jgi:hypothetical protein
MLGSRQSERLRQALLGLAISRCWSRIDGIPVLEVDTEENLQIILAYWIEYIHYSILRRYRECTNPRKTAKERRVLER